MVARAQHGALTFGPQSEIMPQIRRRMGGFARPSCARAQWDKLAGIGLRVMFYLAQLIVTPRWVMYNTASVIVATFIGWRN
jgi:hypothetical protein